MLVDSFAAVTLESVDLRDLQWSSVARLLRSGVGHSNGADAPSASSEDGGESADAVVCLRVAASALASLRGLDGFRHLLALAVPRDGLSSLACQVCLRANTQQASTS
jgi:hypothetical protein